MAAAQARPAPRRDPIVVIGAGLAGLRAADVLQEAGERVMILEARPVPGGRVRTIRANFSDGLHAEAGAIRISGAHRTVLQLVRELGLSLVPFASSTGSAIVSAHGMTVRAPQDLGKLSAPLGLKPDEAGLSPGALLQRYLGDLPDDLADLEPTAEAFSRWKIFDRLTWPTWLQSRGASSGAVTLMMVGGDSRELSALYVLRQIMLLRKSDQFYKIQGGMDRLPRALARRLDGKVTYEAAVTRLDPVAAAVRVEYRHGQAFKAIRARRVILAIPCSTLRRIDLGMLVSPSKAAAIAALPYFPATRFLLQSRSRFWEEAGLSGSARTDQPAEIWDCTYDLPADRGVLGATVGGAMGEPVRRLSQAQTVRFGVDLVAATFGGLATQFEKGTAIRWAQEPWSRGAFAVFHPDQMTAMMPMIGQPEGRLHFAGEHTSSWMGWMEGALESGERAAREVLASESGSAFPQR